MDSHALVIFNLFLRGAGMVNLVQVRSWPAGAMRGLCLLLVVASF